MGTLTKILNRFSGELIFKAEVEGATETIRLRLAVGLACKAGASLAGANLAGANLAGANLAGANLARANLAGANLAEPTWLEPTWLEQAFTEQAWTEQAFSEQPGRSKLGWSQPGWSQPGWSQPGRSQPGRSKPFRKPIANLKLIGKRPIFSIGPIGSRSDYLSAFLTDRGIYLRTGCFTGTVDEFHVSLARTHDGNVHAVEYAAALRLIYRHAELWGSEAEAEAKTLVNAEAEETKSEAVTTSEAAPEETALEKLLKVTLDGRLPAPGGCGAMPG